MDLSWYSRYKSLSYFSCSLGVQRSNFLYLRWSYLNPFHQRFPSKFIYEEILFHCDSIPDDDIAIAWWRLNKRLSKQSGDWWFETISCPLWRHCDGNLSTCHGSIIISPTKCIAINWLVFFIKAKWNICHMGVMMVKSPVQWSQARWGRPPVCRTETTWRHVGLIGAARVRPCGRGLGTFHCTDWGLQRNFGKVVNSLMLQIIWPLYIAMQTPILFLI